jgi:hypothetical protein
MFAALSVVALVAGIGSFTFTNLTGHHNRSVPEGQTPTVTVEEIKQDAKVESHRTHQ